MSEQVSTPLRTEIDRSRKGIETDSHSERLLSTMGNALSVEASALLRRIAGECENQKLLDLRLSDARTLFSPEEQRLLNDIENEACERPASVKSHTVIILKATRLCNLRCTYCNSWREGPGQVMELDILARVLRDALLAPGLNFLDIVWHGGEVTLLDTIYLTRALWIQEHYRSPRITVAHSIQTNATRLTPGWVAFLKDYEFSVGVSVDGPPEVHDARRKNIAGKGSWKDVKRGIDLLGDANVPFGVLAVVDECVIKTGAERYLEYLSKLGVFSVALLNVLPPNDPGSSNTTRYLEWDVYQAFMCDLFRRWWKSYRQTLVIRELQSLVEAVEHGTTGLCLYGQNCMGQYLTIEPDGRVSACDKYVDDQAFTFGSLKEGNLSALLHNSTNLRAAVVHVDSLKTSVSRCDYYKYCKGGCPHDARLNRLHHTTTDSECCGLHLLLEEISSVVGTNQNNERKVNEN